MTRINTGRHMASHEDGLVVFLIGMRMNRLWKLHRWLPVAAAMGRMLAHLSRHPDRGLLGYRFLLEGRGVTLIQYWRDEESLYRFAREADEPHRPAWLDFYRRKGKGSDVGLWHEVYPVAPGAAHGLYFDMPDIGLGRIGELAPAGRRR